MLREAFHNVGSESWHLAFTGVSMVATEAIELGVCPCGTVEPTGSSATHQMLHHNADQLKKECIFLEFICISQFPSLPSRFSLASSLSNLCQPWVEGSGEFGFRDKAALDVEPARGTTLQIWQPSAAISAPPATLTSEGFAKNS